MVITSTSHAISLVCLVFFSLRLPKSNNMPVV
ncbi:hypothetical protein GLYMA_09G230750v4 [Glycine max]|nr:hypothetical protein GLYMA_09G230750v4 [Glycine max]KAH1044393.1 hypothetical protein GYH30_025922 [Glycine max]